jgi:hypothetical protein
MFLLVVALMRALISGGTAPPDEPIPSSFKGCFDGGPLEGAARGAPVRAEEIESARRAFASARSFRACFSYISLFHGASWGALEYAGPARQRWRLRYRGRRDSDPVGTLEVVRIGADTWLQGEGGWTRLPEGRPLKDAVPSAAWLPEPAELVKGLFGESATPSFTGTGSAMARAGACQPWLKQARTEGLSMREAVCVGSRDRLPYRINAGGPRVEAYLQLEVYDYGAPVDIRAPQ